MQYSNNEMVEVYNLGLDYIDSAKCFSKLNEIPKHVFFEKLPDNIQSVVNDWFAEAAYGKIFGASESGRLALLALQQVKKLNFTGFVDNYMTEKFEGLPVTHPQKTKWDEFIVIAVNPNLVFSVLQQLKKYITKNIKIILLYSYPFFYQGKKISFSLKEVMPEIPNYLGRDVVMATSLGVDLRSYITNNHNWQGDNYLASVEEVVYPFIKKNSTILEIGSGLGLYTKHIIKKLQHGTLHLFEIEAYWRDYLKNYFSNIEENVIIHNANGKNFPEVNDASVDLVFAGGVFHILSTMILFNYLKEAARVLKKGGRLIFNFYDSDNTDFALNEIQNSLEANEFFPHYHSGKFIRSFLASENIFSQSSGHLGNYEIFYKK
jgi:SAM-dependent methyltransferase